MAVEPAEAPTPVSEAHPTVFVDTFTNGLLDISGEEFHLLPHTPQLFTDVCIPHPYDPGAKCPAWERFLDEAFEGNLAAFHFCPRIGVAIARIEAADEIFGKSDLGLIAIEGLERAGEDHAAEIPQHSARGFCMPNIHGGATLFTLFLP